MTQKSHKAVIEINNFPSDLVAWLHSLEFIQVKSNDSYRVHKTQFSKRY